MSLPKKEKKKNFCFGNCGNAIADNVKKKKFILTIVAIPLLKMEKKKIVLAIMAMALPKMGKKKDVTKSVKE